MPADHPVETGKPQPEGDNRPERAGRKIFREVLKEPGSIHPALIPGIAIHDESARYKVNKRVFVITAAAVVLFVGWGVSDLDRLSRYSSTAVSWVSLNFGWLFSILTVAIVAFMLIIAFTRTGKIPLGQDGEAPEYSRVSWIAMLFSAGMGIGILFFGAYEPLAFFLDAPPGMVEEPGSTARMYVAMAQTILHWGPMPWSFYALVGGAIAYSAYRRGRSPLISSIFNPIFNDKIGGPIGSIIDVFAILVTLFGTALSLGLGALQIGRGVEIVGGIGPVGNGLIIGIVVVLTIVFIFSAVSGVKKGIRRLSNLNMMVVLVLAIFVFSAGPTLFLLDLIPGSITAFIRDLPDMLMRSPIDGEEVSSFLEVWTTYYWAWWFTWTPFVGLFIAKISRGRTIREFVTVVVLIPSSVCIVWFGIFGGTAMWMEAEGLGVSNFEESQDVLFMLFQNLPLTTVISVFAMLALGIFFVTSADSASLVMGSMTQHGKPVPNRSITITWGLSLAVIAIVLLLAGGETAMSSLQALATISGLPFSFILIGLMVAWGKDLRNDPLVFRQKFAEVAIEEGVKLGIEEYGDDFAFSTDSVDTEHGAGAWLDTEDPALTEWYEEAVEDVEETEAQIEAAEAQEAEELEAQEQELLDPATEHKQLEGKHLEDKPE